MSNEITHYLEPKALEPKADDWGNLDLVHQVSPLIRCDIGQPTNQKNYRAGTFNFAGVDWAPTDHLKDCVLLMPLATRVLFGKTFKDKSRCGSDNFHTPAPHYPEPIHSKCFDCFASKWENEMSDKERALRMKLMLELNITKQNRAPLCNETINLIMVDERMTPFSLRMRKTGLAHVQKVLTNPIKYSGKRIFSRMFDLYLKPADAQKGNWYVIEPRNFRDVIEPVLPQYYEAFQFVQKFGAQMIAKRNQLDETQQPETSPESGETPY